MGFNRTIFTAPAVLFALCRGLVFASAWYVDGSLSGSGDGRSWATAFQTIQEAIDTASHGDTVIVAEGLYVENIEFKGKNITLTSTKPFDPDVVARTIIDGAQARSVVTFDGSEDETCALSGFTIQNGRARRLERGGGVQGSGTHAAICNNVIVGNATTAGYAGYDGGGLAECHGSIRDNAIRSNSASGGGGGLSSCSGLIGGNVISENTAGGGGGGLARCTGGIENNVISENSAGGDGGGLSSCRGPIRNNVISGNEAGGAGGGLAGCYRVIEENVISENTAGAEGGGLSGCGGPISNNVISNNDAGGYGGGLSGCSYAIESNAICWNSAASHGGGLAYCGGAVQNNTIYGNRAGANGGGLYECRGSIRNCIIWRNEALESGNQVHRSSIPLFSCVQDWDGTGQGSTGENPLLVDPDGPDDDPSTYDDNDYHLQGESPCINRGVNYYWLYWPQRDLDRNCRLVGQQVDIGCYEYGSSPDTDGDLLCDEHEFIAGTAPDVPDMDGDGLRDGLEILRGSNPAEKSPPAIIRVPADMPTIQQALCLAFRGEEIIVSPGLYQENVHLSGLDVVLRGSDPHDPIVVQSTILDGGGAAPVVSFMGTESEACIVSGLTIRNGAASWGGGIHGGSRATIQNNVITGNSAGYGGGIHCRRGIIRNNTICRNQAWGAGGGLAACDGTIQNNLIFDNKAGLPGIVYSGRGGAMSDCNGIITGNTIVGNLAGDMDGGLFHCMGATQNCIIWGNTPRQQGPWWQTPSYSCIEGYAGPGQGNIAEEPRFLDAENGNFRLLPDSPCIDAGFNDPELPETDFAGMHRIMFGGKSLTVDMGAYEYYINELEPGPAVDETTLTWSSLAGRSYSVFYSGDLLTWHLADDSLLSDGNETTSWTDDGSRTGVAPSLAPRRFYRILENP